MKTAKGGGRREREDRGMRKERMKGGRQIKEEVRTAELG